MFCAVVFCISRLSPLTTSSLFKGKLAASMALLCNKLKKSCRELIEREVKCGKIFNNNSEKFDN